MVKLGIIIIIIRGSIHTNTTMSGERKGMPQLHSLKMKKIIISTKIYSANVYTYCIILFSDLQFFFFLFFWFQIIISTCNQAALAP